MVTKRRLRRATLRPMSLRSDHKALMFIGVVGVLGAGVRVLRASSGDAAPAEQPALEHQAQVADSSAAAQRGRQGARGARGGRGGVPGRGGRGSRMSSGAGSRDTTLAVASDSSSRRAPQSRRGPRDGPGYVAGKLDLDVATAAQIDSLPGVTPLMARRISSDRVRRGPFLSFNGLQRVSGVGKQFLRQIDSLVTFSGVFAVASPGDTIIKPRAKRR
jgi:competence protein ComEA